MTAAVQKRAPINVVRLQRFKGGETVEKIAQSEGVGVDTVLYSIRRAAERDQMLRVWELIDLKLQGAIDNERIRAEVRRELYTDEPKEGECSSQLIDGIRLLLSGKRQII